MVYNQRLIYQYFQNYIHIQYNCKAPSQNTSDVSSLSIEGRHKKHNLVQRTMDNIQNTTALEKRLERKLVAYCTRNSKTRMTEQDVL